MISLPSHLENGLSRCNLWLVSSTLTFKPVLSDGGGWKVSSPGSNPLAGNSSPYGLSNLNLVPKKYSSIVLKHGLTLAVR